MSGFAAIGSPGGEGVAYVGSEVCGEAIGDVVGPLLVGEDSHACVGPRTECHLDQRRRLRSAVGGHRLLSRAELGLTHGVADLERLCQQCRDQFFGMSAMVEAICPGAASIRPLAAAFEASCRSTASR